MTTEPIPDDCTPPQHAGMTPAEVLADRDAYNAACEGGDGWMREIAGELRKQTKGRRLSKFCEIQDLR